MERFQELPAQHCRREIRLVYASKAHFHGDMELGYTWAAKNKKAWRVSDSAPLFEGINWEGASWHRAKSVQVAAAEVGFTLIPLPLMPVSPSDDRTCPERVRKRAPANGSAWTTVLDTLNRCRLGAIVIA